MMSRKTRKNLVGIKSSSESRLTQAAILLEYSFEHNIDFKNRIIRISGELDAAKFDLVDAGLSEMESQGRSSVTIRINSPGGDIYHALAIVGRLKSSKCQIITEGYGHVMSSATLILACGDKRRMSSYGYFMHHESSHTLEGTTSQVRAEVMQNEREEKAWAEWMAELSSRDTKFWYKTGVGKNSYFSAEELLETGVIDEIF